MSEQDNYTEDTKEETTDSMEPVSGIHPKSHNPYRAFILVLIAVLIVSGISYIPLEKISGGFFKDFNLLSDILDSAAVDSVKQTDSYKNEGIDPALAEAMKGINSGSEAINDSLSAVADSTAPLIPVKPSRVGDMVQIEDYSAAQQGLAHLRRALSQGRLARVAVVGDSYIEGDIFTQDLRDQLQEAYGGAGVGYMNMFSEFPGFRRSVIQSGSGWTEFAANKKAEEKFVGLSQHYFKPTGMAKATYEGTTKSMKHTGSWENSRFLFISPVDTKIKAKTNGDWKSYSVKGSNDVQCIQIPGNTSEFTVDASSPSLVALGVWLDNNKGVSVDCMSSRGFSGITLTKVNQELSRQMAKHINYDLIVLEFGINAMSAKQTDYSIYAKKMTEAVRHIKRCYPDADILIMGVGDRGIKSGSSVVSMASGNNMIAAQREIARNTHSMFWDTREAMGGEGAIAKWSSTGLANKDYVHLTHKGGAQLATELTKAIKHSIGK